VVVFPRQFNALTAAADSKAAVPTWALMQLLAHLPPCAGEPLTVVVDRLGGRSRHAGLLQECFPAALVRVLGETSRESRYRVDTGAGPCDIAFVVGGDQRCLCTALASMASKYLREVLMGRFNAFWQRQLPGLAPTAGYPGDAARFWAAIAPARARLGIPDETLWRAR
jgi:hypothetical protein